MLGSAAIDLAWLAEGQIDASMTLSNLSWDVAAGVVIAREAGAAVVDQDGTTHTTSSTATIAASPGIRDELLSLLATAVNAHHGDEWLTSTNVKRLPIDHGRDELNRSPFAWMLGGLDRPARSPWRHKQQHGRGGRRAGRLTYARHLACYWRLAPRLARSVIYRHFCRVRGAADYTVMWRTRWGSTLVRRSTSHRAPENAFSMASTALGAHVAWAVAMTSVSAVSTSAARRSRSAFFSRSAGDLSRWLDGPRRR